MTNVIESGRYIHPEKEMVYNNLFYNNGGRKGQRCTPSRGIAIRKLSANFNDRTMHVYRCYNYHTEKKQLFEYTNSLIC